MVVVKCAAFGWLLVMEIGFARSFFKILLDEYNYFSFCLQQMLTDVWNSRILQVPTKKNVVVG